MAWDFGYGFDQEDPRLKLIRQMDPGMFPGILSAGQPAQTPGTGLLTALPEDAADRGSYTSLPPSRPIDIAPRAPTPPPIQRSDAGNVVGPPQAMASGPVTQPATSSADPLASIMGGLGRNSDALLSFGAGLMSGRNWGEGLSKGVAGMQEADRNAAVTGVARQKLAQQQQSQNATLSYLMSKGMSQGDAVAAASNPAVLSSLLSQLNKDPTLTTVKNADGTEKQVWLKPGQTPDQGTALGDPYDPNKPDKPQLVEVVNPDGTKTQKWVTPGQAEGVQVGAPYQDAAAKPQLVEVQNADGTKTQKWVTPGQTDGVQVGAPTAKPQKDPTEAQSKDALYARRMEEANAILTRPEIAAASMSRIDRLANAPMVPFGNTIVSKEYQQADQAQRNFINSVLRRESGAAIAASEFENAQKQYFPQPGDAPEVLAQKAQNRQTAIEGVRQGGGPAYKALAAGATPPGGAPLVAQQQHKDLKSKYGLD